ncbi:MAG TPA: CCA tRNA nucleotidyltransferase [Candidatus Hydrogenedens sp.]|nr:CCA tRNA nucleotidyltransferase [Candidatus Hydrogenedens sp.]HOL19811.1 CCA tRNA nucleotidyltransferase [Candidatus Hydrogenedens sp.]HPP58602.1 CCA tRNA nucleotidyltransferase [Candidatus Hydrogenedens sp.]
MIKTHKKNNDLLEKGARKICHILSNNGYIAYFAGGCVRDLIMKRTPIDYDIATNAVPDKVGTLFPHSITLWKNYGVVRVLLPEGEFEVTTFRSDAPYFDGRHPSSVTFSTPEEDAKRRDFTINALFYDPIHEKIIDYVGGQEDIKKRVIRTVGNPYQRFSEDYLRLLRAVRFSARFNFDIEEETLQAMKALHENIKNVSAERIRDEITKILTEGNPKLAFEILSQTELLREILPEIADLQGVQQDNEFHPEGDVWTHTLLALQELKQPPIELAMAVLLHDVGKKETFTVADRFRFPKHESVGAHITKNILERLRFSNIETEHIVWLVKNHMTLLQYPQMKESTRKKLFRNPIFPLLLELVKTDIKASHGDMSPLLQIETDYKAFLKELPKLKPLLCGKDLIALGYTPGPVFKTILSEIENAQLEGTLKTKEEAVQYVLKHWHK